MDLYPRFTYLFGIYTYLSYCHRVTTQLQLINIIIIFNLHIMLRSVCELRGNWGKGKPSWFLLLQT